LYVASVTERHASIQKLKFFEYSLVYAQTEGCGKLRNFDNFATVTVSHGILRTDPRNLAKFTAENCGP